MQANYFVMCTTPVSLWQAGPTLTINFYLRSIRRVLHRRVILYIDNKINGTVLLPLYQLFTNDLYIKL